MRDGMGTHADRDPSARLPFPQPRIRAQVDGNAPEGGQRWTTTMVDEKPVRRPAGPS